MFMRFFTKAICGNSLIILLFIGMSSSYINPGFLHSLIADIIHHIKTMQFETAKKIAVPEYRTAISCRLFEFIAINMDSRIRDCD